MKAFLKKLIFFVLILFTLALCIDLFVSHKIKNSGLAQGEFSVWNDIYSGNINSEMVVYGSSRAWVHLSPQIISEQLNVSSYNLGIDGHGFFLQYFRHIELLKYNRQPKIIIHSLDIFALQKGKELYNYDQFLPYMLYSPIIYNATKDFDGLTSADFVIPGLRYFGKRHLLEHVFNLNRKKDDGVKRDRGYMGKNSKWNDDLELAKKNRVSYNILIDPAIVQKFEVYLKECEQRKIKVILVYSPEFIEGQTFVKNRNDVFGVYSQLALKFKLPFYDYSNDTISFQKKYFYNATHLNKTGAEVFTKMFVEDLSKDGQLEVLKNNNFSKVR